MKDKASTPFILYPLSLILLTSGLIIYLLIKFPFDGLTGQDSYAYYYQAREIWNGMWGLPAPQWPFVGEGLYHWPVGYHLHLIAGFALTGEAVGGGRFITLCMATLVPALVAALVWLAWRQATELQRALAGLTAGVVVLLTGVYMRAGLSLMADVPSIFWVTLGMCCLLRAWSPGVELQTFSRPKIAWAVGCGFSLGIAILTRYISALLLVPAGLYIALWYWQWQRRTHVAQARRWLIAPGVAIGATLCALVPQLVYTLSQGVRPIDSSGSVVWSLGNFFSTSLSGPDGTATYAHPMAEFYFVDPLREVSLGFLSPFYLPALIMGVVALIRKREWAVTALLLSWWLLPPLFFSGGLYQAHRFVIMYLPPLAAMIGIGVVAGIGSLLTLARKMISDRRSEGAARRGVPLARPYIAASALCVIILVSLLTGLIQSWRATSREVERLAAEKNQELTTISTVKGAASAVSLVGETQPRAVVFGLSAALYHYTGWSILDIYNHNEAEMESFLSGDGPRLAVVPEAKMTIQWVDTPSGARWEWLRAHYGLVERGSVGEYGVYDVEDR